MFLWWPLNKLVLYSLLYWKPNKVICNFSVPTTTKESMKDAVVNFVGDKARSLTDIAKKQVMEKTGSKW